MERQGKIDLGMFALLVAFGVVGRWAQPEWNVTPLAAVAMFAGYYYARLLPALLAPLTTLLVSNLLLPEYNNQGVMLVVYGMFFLPVLLGRWVRGNESYARLTVASVVPATVFYLTTNAAVWAFGTIYEPGLAGLLHSYAAGLPFYRAMLLGDVFYVAAMFGSFAMALHYGWLGRRELAPVRVGK